MDRDALIRSIGVHAPPRHAYFLGAGASITSGIPSAGDVIWRWKRDIYLSSLPPGTNEFIPDAALPSARRLIQQALDARGGFPKEGSPEEYSFYANYAYPELGARQRFFMNLARTAVPSAGYRLLAHLLEQGMFSELFTTNFDHLLVRAREAGATRVILEASTDSSTHVRSQIVDDDGVFLHVSLHGDYRYDTLKNTADELQKQEALLRGRMVHTVRRRPLVVLGYSGRDESVMGSLAEGYSTPGSGALYWVGYRGVPALPAVHALIETARSAGYEAHYVEDEGFDVFMRRLSAYLLREKPEELDKLRELIGTAVESPKSTGLRLSASRSTDRLLKSNVWELRLDVTLYAAEARPESSWERMRSSIAGKPVVAALWKGKIYAAGSLSEIRSALANEVTGSWEPTRPEPRDLYDGYVLHKVVEEALVRSLVRSGLACVRAGGGWLIHRVEKSGNTRCGAQVVPYYSAVSMSLLRDKDRFLLSLIPDRFLGETASEDTEARAATLNALLSKQYNGPFNDELKGWAGDLGLSKGVFLDFPRNSGSNVQFEILRGPLFAQYYESAHGPERTPAKGSSVIGFRASEIEEVPLRFGEGRDTHPIKGLLQYGPADAGVYRLERGVRVGIVAPEGHFRELRELIRALSLPHGVVETKSEYLREYPGFSEAYRVPLVTPADESSLFEEVRVEAAGGEVASQNSVLAAVASAAERLVARSSPSVVLVYIPDEWAGIEEVELEDMKLDFHDRVKAHLASAGVRSQLVKQSTLRKDQRLEVLWWLSLALYAKAIRTPWLIDGSDSGAVYVGIGYSQPRQPAGGMIIGCGHVFEASGLGLRFSLGRIPAPVIRNRNPYLTEEQAFDLGVSTRQLFFESRLIPPRRALVVKRTPFRKDEVSGILAGLAGVPAVDLVSIERGEDWRFIAAGNKADVPSPFPVRRGTLVEKTNGDLLLFAHGSVQGRQASRTYFKGGARIPSPLMVRRFAGQTPAEAVARDVLAMTRMDWNSFDMYQSEPAPLAYAARIANISTEFRDLSPEAMDYRLFI